MAISLTPPEAEDSHEEDHDDYSHLQDLLQPLQALAHLLVEDSAKKMPDRFALAAAEGLSEREVEAIAEFAMAGQRCLAGLTGNTLAALESVGAIQKAVHRSESHLFDLVPMGESQSPQQKSVCELFRRFDKDDDGALSEAEFRQAFRKLTGGSLTDSQVTQMVRAADVNHDGFVDIFEFTVWLYSNEESDRGGQPQMSAAEQDMQKQLAKVQAELKVKNKALEKMEELHEEEMKVTHDFWRSIAKHAVLTIDQKVDLQTAEWLGNGKYGFVLKARRHQDPREVVLKMMGIRWAHIAVKEWQHGTMIGNHPNIVEYGEVMLHADDDNTVRSLIKAGYAAGELKSRTKRTNFPDRYICLTQEFMNAGTVQDWIDDDQLRPGGMFVVMRKVAAALAFLHENGATHNDVKPENVMLHQDRVRADDPVVVKLGDLGLTTRSTDRSADFWQYGMTVFCMVTGERFGTRKYRPAMAKVFVSECAQACSRARGLGKLGETLAEVPDILRGVFNNQLTMQQVSQRRVLQRWSFFDEGERSATPASTPMPVSRPVRESMSKADMEAASVRRIVSEMDGDGRRPLPAG